MKEHDYTHGPWHVSNEGKLVIRDDEWLVPVATAGYATNDEELATANLIAAAPDLLEALQHMVERIEYYASLKETDQPNIEDWAYTYNSGDMDEARAAISKAFGEE